MIALVVVATGLLMLSLGTLIGWMSQTHALASFGSSYIPMAPSTAVLFGFIGFCFLGASLDHAKRCAMAWGAVGFVPALFGAIKIIERLFSNRFVFDSLFVSDPTPFLTFPTGRMSPITAAGFICSGVTILLVAVSERRVARMLAGFLGLLVTALGGIVVLGYMFGTPLLYGGHVIPVALTTGIAFCLCGVGLIALNGPSDFPLVYFVGPSPQAMLLRWFLPITILAILCEGLCTYAVWDRFVFNRALSTAIMSILFSIAMGFVITEIASKISRVIEQAEQDRLHLEKVREVFGLFTTPEVVEFALAHHDNDFTGQGERVNVTILFADVRGFTKFANSVPPEDVVGALNEIWDCVVREVKAEGGILNKFMGDGIMALFGAPLRLDNHPRRAARAALRAQSAIARIGEMHRAQGKVPLSVGIGINTGETIAGCVGTRERMEYSVIGHAVNLAARLEKTAKPGQVIVGPETANRLGNHFILRSKGPIHLSGIVNAVEPVEVLGLGPSEERRVVEQPGEYLPGRFWDRYKLAV